MSITVYQPPPFPPDEAAREQFVVASGALIVRDDHVLQSLVEEAATIMGTAMAAISIVYKDWQYLIATIGMAPGAYSRRTSLCGHAVADDERVFYVGDMQADGRFAGNPFVTDNQRLRFYAGAQLAADGVPPLGTLCVFDPRPRAELSVTHRSALQSLATRVMDRLAELKGG